MRYVFLRGACVLSRLAQSLGFRVVWGVSPPPSPASSVSPGSVAVFLRSPLSVHEIRVPHLEKWRLKARSCTVRVVVARGFTVGVSCVYGMPPGHPERERGE